MNKDAPARPGLATLNQILAVPSLEGAQVQAGGSGLDTMVSDVTVGEVPDIPDWLQGGELVLSTLYAVADDEKARSAFVQRLAEKGAAGLLTKPGRFVGTLDEDILALAERRAFPVVVVEEEVRWTDVVADIYELALGKRMEDLERSSAIQRDLFRVAAEGGGYERLADTASGLLRLPVAITDDQGRALATSPTDGSLPPPSVETMAQAVGADTSPLRSTETAQGEAVSLVTAPILVGGIVLGGVSTTDRDGISALDESVLSNAATVAAVLMSRDQVRLETELRLRGDFLVEVHAARPGDSEDLVGKAALLGADLGSGVAVLAVRIDPSATTGTGVSELERSLTGYIQQQHRNTLVTMRGPEVFAFLGAQRGQGIAEFRERADVVAGRLADHLKAAWPGGAHAVGLGRPHAAENLGDALREAEVALKVAARFSTDSPLVHYDDVGSYRILVALAASDPSELERFASETIGPIEDAGRDLLETLRVYIEADGSISEVASRLYLHRHSVRYRLDRMTKLTGLDPRSSEGRERLGLGLKARNLLDTLRA